MDEAQERPRVLLVNRSFVLNDEGELLLLKRAERHSSAGYWECPGGKLDEGQNLDGVLEREVLEETGLVVQPIDQIVTFYSEVLTQGKYAGMPYVVLYGVSRVLHGILRLSDEHDESVWVTYEEALQYRLRHDVLKAMTVLERYLGAKHLEVGQTDSS